MLHAGDLIPDFALFSDTAGEVTASGLRGQRFVLYFYPRDDTSGCTIEACNFRDHLPNFSALKVPVFGISPDDLKSHVKFRTKYGLSFPLLADPEHAVAEAFGAWVEKNMYGRKYMGIQRSTFVVGPDGHIDRVWEKVNPAAHAKEVLAYLQSTPVAHNAQLAGNESELVTAASAEASAPGERGTSPTADKQAAVKATRKTARKAVQKPGVKKTARKAAKNTSKKTARKTAVKTAHKSARKSGAKRASSR